MESRVHGVEDCVGAETAKRRKRTSHLAVLGMGTKAQGVKRIQGDEHSINVSSAVSFISGVLTRVRSDVAVALCARLRHVVRAVPELSSGCLITASIYTRSVLTGTIIAVFFTAQNLPHRHGK